MLPSGYRLAHAGLPGVAQEPACRYCQAMRMRLLALLLLVMVATACSSGADTPALTDVARQYSEAYCTSLRVCMNEAQAGAFDQVYPGGLDECTDRTLTISGTSEKSICSQEQWDRCAEDLRKAECTGDATARRPVIPPSCQGC
jgi:hypothetical protein